MDKAKCAALFILVAAVSAAASTSALAEKGGRGRQLGVPDVNLGLSKIDGTTVGVGTLVPVPQLSVAPGLMRGPVGNGNVPGTAAPGASGLTPAAGMTPPGRLATPGLRLGNGSANGAMPAAAAKVQPDNSDGIALVGRSESGNETASGAAPGRAAAMDRVAATDQVAERNASEGSAAMPRQLPTCR